MSVKTVETYRARIAEKLGLRTRAEIVRFAVQMGLLTSMLSRACRPARSANAGCPRDSSRSTAPPHLPSGISPTHHRIISIVPDTNKRAWVPSCFVAFVRRGSTRSLTNGGFNIAATQASRSRHKQLIDDLLDPRNELERRVAKRTELRDGNAFASPPTRKRTASRWRTMTSSLSYCSR